MTINEIVEKYSLDREQVTDAVLSNGFSTSADLDERQVHLVRQYVDYLEALADAKEQRIAFKYVDGEESVDKSDVFNQYRRHANDLYAKWSDSKRLYDRELNGKSSYFTVRKRAGFLDARTR